MSEPADLLARQLTQLSARLANLLQKDNFPHTIQTGSILVSTGIRTLREHGVTADQVKELVDMAYAKEGGRDGST